MTNRITPKQPNYEFSHVDEIKVLHCHFDLFYRLLAENKFIPDATFETLNNMTVSRCLSGLPTAYNNAIRGCPSQESDWDNLIKDQLTYFKKAQMPFVWYLDENENKKFKDKLLEHGFKDQGILQGVIGILKMPLPDFELPKGCELEMVKDEEAMHAFNELVCLTFGFKDSTKDFYKKFMWNISKGSHPKMCHWIARKDGKVVSAVSTLIEGKAVSFWNGATLPEFRRLGFSSALRKMALKDAISKGCCIGMSYLMAEGLALGICKKLGYKPKWRFHAFVSP